MAYKDTFGVEFSDDKRKLIKCPTTIVEGYFVPYGVDTIEKKAFENCNDLKNITLPSSLRTVESSAFSGCKALKDIHYAGSTESWLHIKWNGYFDTGYNLYFDNNLVTEVTIPLSISTIQEKSFYYCTSLKKVTFHKDVTRIEKDAFNKSGLKGDLIFVEGLKYIGAYAFFNCNGLEKINIPQSVESIYYASFSCCYNLMKINVDIRNKLYKSEGGALIKRDGLLIAVPKKAYESTVYTIPKWVNRIADETFCHSGLPAKGIRITHRIEKSLKDVFRNSRGIVYVPVGDKAYYISLGIPEELLKEYFVLDNAFNNDTKRFTILENNPFRVLGVYANSSQKEIQSNVTRIKRYLEIDEQVTFENDFCDILGPIIRTKETVEKALSLLNDPREKLKYANFWFSKGSELCSKLISELRDGDLEEVCNKFHHSEISFQCSQAIMILEMMKCNKFGVSACKFDDIISLLDLASDLDPETLNQ